MQTHTYSGSGNTFTLIDNREGSFLPEKKTIKALSSGKDGVVLLETSHSADLKMRIFNADGSEAEMCGNGARCLLTFYKDLTGYLGKVTLETKAGLISGQIDETSVSLFLPLPKEIKNDLQIDQFSFDFLNTGVPHAVFFVDDLEKHPLIEKGHALKTHPLFGPSGSNINFVKCLSDKLEIRTFERGLDHESPACGTGATAAAYLAITKLNKDSPITVLPKSKEPLQIGFDREKGFELKGKVELILLELFHESIVN